jgi:twitching motility two-component system response regulator PilG
MLSGKDGFFDKIRGRMAGSTQYVTKPFKPDALLQVVKKHCLKK